MLAQVLNPQQINPAQALRTAQAGLIYFSPFVINLHTIPILSDNSLLDERAV